MQMLHIFGLTLAVISNAVGSSSQSDRNPHGGREAGPSSSAAASKQHTPDQSSTEELRSRASSRSPDSSTHSITVLGYSLRELGFIRLVSRTNPNLQFEFRYHEFAAGTQICWKKYGQKVTPLPAGKHMVLSTSNGDIFAMMDYSGVLFGIYRRKQGNPRVKMNMISGAIDDLTKDEIRDCPVGRKNPIHPLSFIKAFANTDSLQFKLNVNEERNPGSFSPARQYSTHQSSTPEESIIRERSVSPPGRPPSDQVFGYTMEELGHLRLIPRKNQDQRFEFRRYIFPTDKRIHMRISRTNYMFGPHREYIVVSASNGDVFAIFDYSGTLRGIYTSHARAKINMITGAVDDMTSDEIRDCPVGGSRPMFPHAFMKEFVANDSLQFDRNPNDQQNPGYSSPIRQHPLDRTPLQEPPVDVRASSPPGRPPSHEILGYTIEQLGYVRLIPEINPNRQFEFRRYIFPPEKKIQVMFEYGKFVHVPIREHIVLSTSNGEVFAILEYTEILRGIYQALRRIKINMINGEVDYITDSERKECRVGKKYPIIPRWFRRVISDRDSLQYVYHY